MGYTPYLEPEEALCALTNLAGKIVRGEVDVRGFEKSEDYDWPQWIEVHYTRKESKDGD